MKISYLQIILIHTFLICISCSDSTDTIQQEQLSNNSKIYEDVDIHEIPEFVGGQESLNSFLSTQIRNNENYLRLVDNVEGVIFVNFIIDSTGHINDVKLIKGLDKDLDELVVHTVSNMPDWEPGFIDGSPVNVRYTLPISIPVH